MFGALAVVAAPVKVKLCHAVHIGQAGANQHVDIIHGDGDCGSTKVNERSSGGQQREGVGAGRVLRERL